MRTRRALLKITMSVPAASMLHVAGTLIVIFNSARLVRKGEELEHFHPEMETPKSGLTPQGTDQLTPKLA